MYDFLFKTSDLSSNTYSKELPALSVIFFSSVPLVYMFFSLGKWNEIYGHDDFKPNLFIHSSFCPSVHPSIYSSFLFIHAFVYFAAFAQLFSFIHLFSHTFRFIRSTFFHSFIYLFIFISSIHSFKLNSTQIYFAYLFYNLLV
jgi:hypothetical protein